eukprot:c4138_g1_i1.p1 GENE.c4138_g1_i1~~c4138_g1_i1.p1  ORF type:complete len:168 (+),score=37.97 c4138_g1_i1:571-1074(+)
MRARIEAEIWALRQEHQQLLTDTKTMVEPKFEKTKTLSVRGDTTSNAIGYTPDPANTAQSNPKTNDPSTPSGAHQTLNQSATIPKLQITSTSSPEHARHEFSVTSAARSLAANPNASKDIAETEESTGAVTQQHESPKPGFAAWVADWWRGEKPVARENDDLMREMM